MNEQQELEHYEEGMKWLDEAKEDFDKWFTRMQGEVQTDQQRRVRVLVNSDLDPFQPQYSHAYSPHCSLYISVSS